MARERGEVSTSFVPAAKLKDLLEEATTNGEFFLAEASVSGIARDYLKSWLKILCPRTQHLNNNWAENKLEEIRQQRDDWSYDGMWVDEEGKVVGEAVWSTYKSFLHNAELHFGMEDLIGSIIRSEKMVYPLSPKYETVIFWQDADEEKVVEAVKSTTGDFEVNDFANGLRMARVRRDKVGPMAFVKVGITMGNIGFWESRRLALGQFGHGIYVPRVAFRDTALLPKGAYITPLNADAVKERGGRLMEEKYPDVPIVRIDEKEAKADFISATLLGQRPNEHCPVVLSYTTPRLWLGEGPKHGSGGSGSEPQIPHR